MITSTGVHATRVDGTGVTLRCSAEAELVAFRVLHHDPPSSMSGAPLRGRSVDQRGTESDEARDLDFGVTTREIDVHAVLRRLALRHTEEEEVPDAAMVGSVDSGEVVACFIELVASCFAPEVGERPRVGAVECHVEDER
jgi:hypothetical protein